MALKHETGKSAKLLTENGQMLDQMTSEKTQIVQMDRQLEEKEEQLAESEERHARQLKAKAKEIQMANDEVEVANKRLVEVQARHGDLERKLNEHERKLGQDFKRKEQEWSEQKVVLEQATKRASFKFGQCLDFIESARVDQQELTPQIDAKIRHYFNAAFQNLTSEEQKLTQISVEETRQLLRTIVQGTQKTLKTIDHKFEQFLHL